MRNPGSKLGRPIVGLAAVLLAGSAFASPASAAPTGPAADPSFAPSALASTLDSRLGDRTAGSYVDSSGKLVVNVTDAATAQSVTAAGATPRYVQRSGAVLAAADATLKSTLKTPLSSSPDKVVRKSPSADFCRPATTPSSAHTANST